MKRGLPPLPTPPEPALMFGQMRALAPEEPPLQVGENVAVVSTVALAVRSTVPKLRLVMVKVQSSAAHAGSGKVTSTASATSAEACKGKRRNLIDRSAGR